MHDCIEVFTKVLDARCREENGFAVVDINRMLGNLTSVRLSPLTKPFY
jgi:hypothetical protein